MLNPYSVNFYDTIRSGVLASVDIISPVVMELVQPETVIDIGCGEGHWAEKFKDYGCSVKGVDGAYVTDSPLGKDFIAADITKSMNGLPKSDLAICLEVAEHLDAKYADSFIADLSSLAPTILFSAAIPRQSGAGHVHCRWPTYWQNLFAQHNKEMSGSIRDQFWDDDRIEPWYRQNLMIVTSTPEKYPALFPDTTVLDRVHPVIASWWV